MRIIKRIVHMNIGNYKFISGFLLLTMLFASCSEPIRITKELTGTFTYRDLSITAENSGSTSSPTWSDNLPDHTIRYTIVNSDGEEAPSGILIHSSGGTVKVGDDATTGDSGAYEVIATGTGIYTGAVTGSIEISIKKKQIKGPLMYASLKMVKGGTGSFSVPDWSFKIPGQTITYTIVDRNGNENDIPSSIDFRSDEFPPGLITMSGEAVPGDSGCYTVTAKGKGGYQGTITGYITVAIYEKTPDPITGSFSYPDLSVKEEVDTSEAPRWSESSPGERDVFYCIDSMSDNITIDASTGKVTVKAGATVDDLGEYTVTATGKGYYFGTKIGTITITKDPQG